MAGLLVTLPPSSSNAESLTSVSCWAVVVGVSRWVEPGGVVTTPSVLETEDLEWDRAEWDRAEWGTPEEGVGEGEAGTEDSVPDVRLVFLLLSTCA
jgi:hypothetical protein